MTIWKLGKGADFEVWCYSYDTGRTERTAIMGMHVASEWRVAVARFEESDRCQKYDLNQIENLGPG